jgi:hypothetical protein
MATLVDRWLILEQESDRGQWHSECCTHLVWNSSALKPKSGVPSHIPSELEICILFLADHHGNFALPETFSNTGIWQWNVWCHYGRDISMDELQQRWRSYVRLAEVDKARLSTDSAHPPLPFSRSMLQPWTAEFRELKKQVWQPNEASFSHCLNLLKQAKVLATGTQGIQQRLEQAQESLPVVMAARYLLDSLPMTTLVESSACPDILRSAIDLCQHSGLMAMAHRKERFSRRLREAYRQLGWTVMSINYHLQDQDKLTLGQVDLMRLRWSLHAFVKTAEDEATATSEALIKDVWGRRPYS